MKIVTLEEMSRLMHVRRMGVDRKWVMAHGVFDILHPGHIAHLEWAKQQGDLLIVSITPDGAVQKGSGRPHFKQAHRADQVAALQCVDYVVVNESLSAEEILAELEPQVYAKGVDVRDIPTRALGGERQVVEGYGGRVVFGPEEPIFHSTDLVDKLDDA